MQNVLVVVRPFGTYRVGELISEGTRIREALAGEHAQDVVRTAAPVAAQKEV